MAKVDSIDAAVRTTKGLELKRFMDLRVFSSTDLELKLLLTVVLTL